MYSYLPSCWASGINTDSLKWGTTPDGLKADLKWSFEVDSSPIENYIQINAYLQDSGLDGLGLQRLLIPTSGEDSYNLKVKASDIKYVARYIKTNIIAVNSTTEIKIPIAESQIMENYHQAKLTANALGTKLVALITKSSDGTQYFREFTISSQIVTLTQAVTGLSVNDTFELVHSYDLLKDGTEQTTGLPAEHYVIKYCNPTTDASISFYPLSKPDKNINAYVIVYYNAISETKPKYYDSSSISKYGLKKATKELDFVLSSDQLEQINQDLQKKTEPKITLTLETIRPELAKKNWQIPVNIDNFYNGVLKVVDVQADFKSLDSQVDGMSYLVQTVTLSNYSDSFVRLLASLKRISKVKQNILDNLEKAYFKFDFPISNFYLSMGNESIVIAQNWDYATLTKGFYFNNENEDLTDKTGNETGTLINATIGSIPFFGYKNYLFNGSNAYILATSSTSGFNEVCTKFKLEIQFNFDVDLSSGQEMCLMSREVYLGGGKGEFRALIRNDSGTMRFYIHIYNDDYSPNFYIEFTQNIAFVKNTDYSLIFSVDFINKYKTLVVNSTDYSTSLTEAGLKSFASYNEFKINRDSPTRTTTAIGITQYTLGSWFSGKIWRPLLSLNEYISGSDALIENAKFGF